MSPSLRFASPECSSPNSFSKRFAVQRLAAVPALIGTVLAFGCSNSDNATGGDTSLVGGSSSPSTLGGAAALGGALGSGGTTSGIAGALTGGAAQAGGNAATGGGAQATGGKSSSTGGASATGGFVSAGGSGDTGGTSGTRPAGGNGSAGGSSTAGGATAMGGTKAGGGTSSLATGGSVSGGSSGTGPCDIYAAANTPCSAAHSTARALFGAYNGNLYQVRRASDKTTKDIPVLAPGGFANVSLQDTFCAGTTCTISILYDQTTNHNDLVKSPTAHWLPNGGNEANAANGKITINGHTVHGIYVTGYSGDVAYRNNATKGVAKNNEAESMYMVVDGKRYSNQCCFDYGNAETSGNDDGNGTMEAIYWGNDTTWGGKADGNGPWVAADLENGMFKCQQGGWQTTAVCPNNKAITATFATAMLKGPAANTFTLKGGNAQSGSLTTMYNGARPTPSGYYPKRLQGAIILGTGGDGSNGGTGTFFEGAITNGNPPDSVDDAIQANIVAAGYGK